MTVKLLIPYDGNNKGDSVDYDNATEAALVAQGIASYLTNPGSQYYPLTATEQQTLRDMLLSLSPASPNDQTAAIGNVTNINQSLARTGRASIPGGLGIAWTDGSIVMPSNSILEIGAGTTLMSVNGRQAPLIKNKYSAQINNQPNFVRAANVVTVADAGHTKQVGDLQFISGANAAFRGLLPVIAAVPGVSWSYASAGADGQAGATGTFFNVIPVRRTLPGSALTAVAFFVTVTDPGHDMRVGMNVWIGKDGGDNFAPGVVKVTRCTSDTWSYQTSAAVGTATGTFALNYDFNITITGGGTLNGNRSGLGVPSNGNIMRLCVAEFGCVTSLTIDAAIGGTSLRSVNAHNCAYVKLGSKWRGFDTLVDAQFEGGIDGIVIDQAEPLSSAMQTVGAQQIDDCVAFTGTKFASGAGGNYDNTISPYGLTFFAGIENRRTSPIASLNGLKLTSHSDCPFLGTIKVGSIIGRALDNNYSLTQGSCICLFDDGPGLVGTTVEALDIAGPLEWKTQGASNANLNFAGAGSIGSVMARDIIGELGPSCLVKVSNTIAIKSMDFDACKFIALGNNNPNFNISGGTTRKLKVRNSRVTVGTNMPFILANGGVVNEIELDSLQVSSSSAATGIMISAAASMSLSRLAIKGIRTEQGANNIQTMLSVADGAYGTVDIYIDDVDITSASFITTPGSGVTGTFNVFLGKKVRWAATGGGELLAGSRRHLEYLG